MNVRGAWQDNRIYGLQKDEQHGKQRHVRRKMVPDADRLRLLHPGSLSRSRARARYFSCPVSRARPCVGFRVHTPVRTHTRSHTHMHGRRCQLARVNGRGLFEGLIARVADGRNGR